MRRGAGNALMQLLSPAVWNAGHRVAIDVMDIMRGAAETPMLVSVVCGTLPEKNRTGAQWRGSFATREIRRFPIPTNREQARVDLSQSHLGSVFSLMQAANDNTADTVAWAVYFTRIVLSMDAHSCMAPGWETTGLAVRAGLLRALAALAPAAHSNVQKEIGVLLGSLVHILSDWLPADGAAAKLNAFQKEWLLEFMIEPLQVLFGVDYVLETAKMYWGKPNLSDQEFMEQIDKALQVT